MIFDVPNLAQALHKVKHPDSLFIGGEWVQPSTNKRLSVISPVSEQELGTVPEATVADVDRAVAAARKAFDSGPWPRMSRQERAAHLRELARHLSQRVDALSYLWTLEAGAPEFFASRSTAGCANLTQYYADLIESTPLVDPREREAGGVAVVVREAVGVVAAVVPWNAPVVIAMLKIAPALAAGCTVVVKPAPETPLDAYILAECVEAAGLPPGTVNIVACDREASDHLIRHPQVDKVAFTGSTATGRHIMKACSDRLARVTLELGGKSAAVVLDDISVEDAMPGIVAQVSGNCGQVCVTLSRLLVPAARIGEFEDAISAAFKAVKIGDPFDPKTQIGTLAMKRQFDRVNEYIRVGKAEGARLVTGGKRPEAMERGYFFEPTLFSNANNNMRIAREEIFGPVVTMIPYESVDHAVEIANDTDYGLHGAVFTNDIERAYALGRRLKTGNVGFSINTLDLKMPFGGWKQSGVGREGGVEGLGSFLESKTIYLPSVPDTVAAAAAQ